MTLTAAQRGWGPGWPNCQAGKIKTLVRKDGIRLPLRIELMDLVAFLCDETERRGYNLVNGWCWGYACRPVRDSRVASNHSWGLAVDLNAPNNPMGSRLITDMPNWMFQLWEAHMFRCGARYKTRPDAMHYEFMGTPTDAKRITAAIYKGAAPVNVAPALPIYFNPKKQTETLIMAAIQIMANKFNGKYHLRHDLSASHRPDNAYLKVDGRYGPMTADWIGSFKRWNIKFQKDFHLPVWPNDDYTIGLVTYGTLQFWTK